MSEKQTQPVPLDAMSEELTFPVRVACIDVGSNALRYVAAEFRAPDKYRIVEQEPPLLHQDHDRDAGHGLGLGGDAEDCVSGTTSS